MVQLLKREPRGGLKVHGTFLWTVSLRRVFELTEKESIAGF